MAVIFWSKVKLSALFKKDCVACEILRSSFIKRCYNARINL